MPPIVPLKAFDNQQHAKLCSRVSGTIPQDAYQELINLPKFIAELPEPETFEEVLNRIKSKVVERPADFTIPEDIDNEEMNEFINNTVNKVWQTPENLIEKSKKSKNEPKNPRKRKPPQMENDNDKPKKKKRIASTTVKKTKSTAPKKKEQNRSKK